MVMGGRRPRNSFLKGVGTSGKTTSTYQPLGVRSAVWPVQQAAQPTAQTVRLVCGFHNSPHSLLERVCELCAACTPS